MESKNNMLKNVDDYEDTGIWKGHFAVRVDVHWKTNNNIIKKSMIIKKSKSYRGFHQATISESISQSKGKYEWNQKTTCWGYKLEGDPSQIAQQILNQPIEIEIQNHIRGFHQATISESLRQRKGKYGWNNKNNMLRNVDDYWDTGIWKRSVAVRVDVH